MAETLGWIIGAIGLIACLCALFLRVHARPTATPTPEPRIVEAVLSAPAHRGGDPRIAEQYQHAMVVAVKLCQAHGIKDPKVIRRAQLDALAMAKHDLESERA